MRVTVLTPIIRPRGALEAARSVQVAMQRAPAVWVEHRLCYWRGEPDASRYLLAQWLTELMHTASSSWLCWLDDDNRMHPDFLRVAAAVQACTPEAEAFVFGMAYPEMGGVLRANLPPEPCRIDGGQTLIWRDYAIQEPWKSGPAGDGEYLAALYARNPTAWRAVPDVVTAHNHQNWSDGWPTQV